jgi:hypothetical protein
MDRQKKGTSSRSTNNHRKGYTFFSLSQITNLAMAMTDETGKGWRRPYDCGKED